MKYFDFTQNDTKKCLCLRKKIAKSKNKVAKKIRTIKYKRLCHKNNAFIAIKAIISDNVVFPHGIYGIFISQGAQIGDNCTIFHQVTIGSNTLPDSKYFGAPTIGKDVYIGAGAKIIGNVTIGDNVRIGANAVVTKDVPDNATVVQASPRIILHDEVRDNRFQEYKGE